MKYSEFRSDLHSHSSSDATSHFVSSSNIKDGEASSDKWKILELPNKLSELNS